MIKVSEKLGKGQNVTELLTSKGALHLEPALRVPSCYADPEKLGKGSTCEPDEVSTYIDKCNIYANYKLSDKHYDILSNRTKNELFHLYYSKCLGNAYMKCLKREENPTNACDKLVDEYIKT